MALVFAGPAAVLEGSGLAQTRSSFLHPVERVREYLRAIRLLLGQTRDQLQATRIELAAHMTQLETLASSQLAHLERLSAGAEAANASRDAQHAQLLAQLETLAASLKASNSAQQAQHSQLLEGLRLIHSRGQRGRERLHQLRADPSYGQSYTDPDPLVSVVIATYDNRQTLRERAIPSVLAQTYQNFEIVVVGDAAPEATHDAIKSFDDPRIRFANRAYPGPYPADPEARWRASGVPPYNEGVQLARGMWIAPLDDDDAFRPNHLELLLAHARKERLELAYARLCQHAPDGVTTTLGSFPPELGKFGFQASICISGIARIFDYDVIDAVLGVPCDWAVCLRMLEAGVRIGMLDEETADYYPSLLWMQREE